MNDGKKRGRPIKNPDEKLSVAICIRLNMEDAVALNKICEVMGMSKRAFIKDCIVKKYYDIATEDFDVFDYYDDYEGPEDEEGLEKD